MNFNNATFILHLVLLLVTLFLVAKAEVIDVKDDNWAIVTEGEWMLKFYAPWCPACKAIAPVWQDFSNEDDNLDIKVGKIDVSESPGLSGRFLVTSLPTIYHVLNGEYRIYTGSRGKDDFVGYIANKRYTELEPVPFWKAPNSFGMSFVSLVFKLSMAVRHFHLVMTTEYGFPAWTIYVFFAVCTVVMGLVLGMILVFVTDFICPSRPPARHVAAVPQMTTPTRGSTSDKNKEDENQEEEEEEEEKEQHEQEEEEDEQQKKKLDEDGEEQQEVREGEVEAGEEEVEAGEEEVEAGEDKPEDSVIPTMDKPEVSCGDIDSVVRKRNIETNEEND